MVVVVVVVVVVYYFVPLETQDICEASPSDSVARQSLNLDPVLPHFLLPPELSFSMFALVFLSFWFPAGSNLLLFFFQHIHPPSSESVRSIAIFSFKFAVLQAFLQYLSTARYYLLPKAISCPLFFANFD